jgi:hypothetical protein
MATIWTGATGSVAGTEISWTGAATAAITGSWGGGGAEVGVGGEGGSKGGPGKGAAGSSDGAAGGTAGCGRDARSSFSRYSAVILSNELEATRAARMPKSLALARTCLFSKPSFFEMS